MKSIAGLLGFLVFMVIMVVLAGNWIEARKAAMSKCTDTRAQLGLCVK